MTDNAVHQMLDALVLNSVSLHSAYSATGANEIAGGTYARQVAAYAAAAARARALTGSESFTGLPAGASVAWIGRWDSAGPTFKGMAPNGAAPKGFQVDVLANTILCEGLLGPGDVAIANGHRVVFYGGAAPTGLTIGTAYYVVGATAEDPDHFQVSLTEGGAAIDITGQPGAGCVVSRIVIETYAAADGTFNLTGDSLSIPGTV